MIPFHSCQTSNGFETPEGTDGQTVDCDLPVVLPIAAAFWSLSKITCHLKTNNSSSFDSIFFLINLTLRRSLLQMKVIKSRYQNCLTDEHLKYYLYLCLSNLSLSYSKICSATNQLRNRKVSERHL